MDDETAKPAETPYAVIDGRGMTKEDFTAWTQSKISEAVAPKIRERDRYKSEAEELQTVKAELDAIQTERDNKNRTVEQRWEADRLKLESQADALRSQIEAEKTVADQVRDRWHDTYRREYVLSLASQSGAAKEALGDIAVLFPQDQIRVVETDNGLTAQIVDPVTGIEREATTAMGEWLETKPHLRSAPPVGAGAPAAGPAGPAVPDQPASGAAGLAALMRQNGV